MEYIQIPAPDFSFQEIAKERAEMICRSYLNQGDVVQLCYGIPIIDSRITKAIQSLNESSERLYCIVLILNHLTETQKAFLIYATGDDIDYYTKGINRIRYEFYALANRETGYKFNKDAFSEKEVDDLTETIKEITVALDNLSAGQYFLGEEVQDIKDAKDDITNVKDEFSLLKENFILGKSIWFKIAKGIILNFMGKKFLDAASGETIEPLFKNLLRSIGIDKLLS